VKVQPRPRAPRALLDKRERLLQRRRQVEIGKLKKREKFMKQTHLFIHNARSDAHHHLHDKPDLITNILQHLGLWEESGS
jgi:hypothetical protein